MAVELSYCVVNTNGRADLITGLEAIRSTHPAGVEAELIVLDNASDDGSAAAVHEWSASAGGSELPLRVIARERRAGKAENDTLLLREARGRLCLLLNEDAELKPGAAAALIGALDSDPGAGAAGAQLLDAEERPLACAWRLPGIAASLAAALLLHKRFVTQSGGTSTREVGWVQSSAMLVRADAAEAVGWLDPAFFVYSDETDFEKRLSDAGWRIVYVPAARAIHHEQLANDRSSGERRLVEFHRNRDLYMRKHHGAFVAAICRVLNALPYLPRALASAFLPRRSARLMLLHARRALRPYAGGPGIREAAATYNARLASGAVIRSEE